MPTHLPKVVITSHGEGRAGMEVDGVKVPALVSYKVEQEARKLQLVTISFWASSVEIQAQPRSKHQPAGEIAS